MRRMRGCATPVDDLLTCVELPSSVFSSTAPRAHFSLATAAPRGDDAVVFLRGLTGLTSPVFPVQHSRAFEALVPLLGSAQHKAERGLVPLPPPPGEKLKADGPGRLAFRVFFFTATIKPLNGWLARKDPWWSYHTSPKKRPLRIKTWGVRCVYLGSTSPPLAVPPPHQPLDPPGDNISSHRVTWPILTVAQRRSG